MAVISGNKNREVLSGKWPLHSVVMPKGFARSLYYRSNTKGKEGKGKVFKTSISCTKRTIAQILFPPLV